MSTTGKDIISKWFDELQGWGGDPACIELGKRFDAELQQAQAAATGLKLFIGEQKTKHEAALAAVTLERDEAKAKLSQPGTVLGTVRYDRTTGKTLEIRAP